MAGGSERVMSELANEFSSKGHEVHLCLLADAELFYTVDPLVRVHNFAATSKFQTCLKLRYFLKELEPDFVLSFMAQCNLLTITACLFLKLRVYVSDRDNPKNKFPVGISVARKLLYRSAAGVVAQTLSLIHI